MLYRNGRPAKNGDKVVMFSSRTNPVVGILYDAVEWGGAGKLAVTSPNDPCPDLVNCLHLDDVLAAVKPLKKDWAAALKGQPIVLD